MTVQDMAPTTIITAVVTTQTGITMVVITALIDEVKSENLINYFRTMMVNLRDPTFGKFVPFRFTDGLASQRDTILKWYTIPSILHEIAYICM
jgi:hypothetical protein